MRRWFAIVAVAFFAAGCGTEAVGVAACRQIEESRCSAGAACGFPDVEACHRFHRDHCLHGVAVEEVREVDVQSCMARLEAAGQCATELGAEAAPADCSESLPAPEAVTICDVVLRPELLNECAFLTAEAANDDDATENEDASEDDALASEGSATNDAGGS